MRAQRRVALGLVLLGLLALWFGYQPDEKTSSPVAREAPRVAPRAPVAPAPARSAQMKLVPPPPTEDTPIIDDVIVEKEEVCEGEENLITIDAHMPKAGDDVHLRYFVAGGKAGRQVPLRSYLPSPGEDVPDRYVFVHGKNGATAQAPVPHFKIKPCKPARAVFIKSETLKNAPHTYVFRAMIRTTGGTAFNPVSYEWTFSDGQKARTETPRVEHRFELELEPDAFYSYFLVGCTAVAQNGDKATGRLSVEIGNKEAQQLSSRGVLRLTVTPTPRFPELDDRGWVEQKVRVWHLQSAPVTIEKILVTEVSSDGARSMQKEVDPASILPTTLVTRQGVETTLRFNANDRSGVQHIDYEFIGRSERGYPAVGNFSLMRPTPRPTPDGPAIEDPYLIAMIQRAQQRLKKRQVTADDLHELDQEGAFEDIKRANYPIPEPTNRDPGGKAKGSPSAAR